MVALGDAVFERSNGETEVVQERGAACSLLDISPVSIAAARTDDDGIAIGLGSLGLENLYRSPRRQRDGLIG